MKKAIILVLSLAMVFTACEENDIQNNDIPSVVLNAFTEKFSNATHVEWEKIGEEYEVEFDLEAIDYEAIIQADGTILKYKNDISFKALPEAIKETIIANYNKTKIDEVDEIHIGETIYYQVEFEAEPIDNKIIFEKSGQVTTEITTW